MVLSLRVLGGFTVLDEAGNARSLPTRKTRALLGYLAANADKPQPRERLMALLWSDRGERQARHSLNQGLLAIRKLDNESGRPLLEGDAEHVVLGSEAIDADIVRFRAHLADNPAAAAALYKGAFLDGLAVPDPAFEEWLAATRSELHRCACDALERAIEAAGANDRKGAVDFARRLIALDPLYEEGHRRLMTLLHRSGDRAGALRHYRTCAEILDRELNVEPDAATKALYEKIRGGTPTPEKSTVETAADDPTAPPPLPDRPSIAVLPFTNLGGDPEQAYLAEGLRLDIQTMLVRVPGLFLISTGPVNAQYAADAAADRIAAAVGVRYVLEGAVQRSGRHMRATVQLTDTAESQVIWAERYDRALDDNFTVQDEIASEVLTALDVKLLSGDRYRFRSTLHSFEVRDLFYRGLNHFYASSRKDNEKARQYFERVAVLQPESAAGPTYLCMTYWRDAFIFSPESRDESLEKALEWAKNTPDIATSNGLSHIVFAAYHLVNRQHEQAMSAAQEAFKMRPNCPIANASLAQIMLYCGKSEDAIETMQDAMRISLVYPPWFANVLAAAYRERGELDNAITTARQALGRNPNDVEAQLNLCSSYMLAARSDRAERTAREILLSDGTFSVATYIDTQPFKDPVTLNRLSDSLLKAGLPA